MEWIARLVGAFYVVAGVITVRQAVINWRLERIFGAFAVYTGPTLAVLWWSQSGVLG